MGESDTMDEMKKRKAKMLLSFVDREKRVTKINDVVDGFKIGKFWDKIKQGQNRDIYLSIISKNKLLSDDYEKTQKIKEEKRGQKEMTIEDKANVLLSFVDREKRIPKQNKVVDGFKIGAFWSRMKQGKTHSDIYLSILSKNKLLSTDYEKTQKIKEEKRGKEMSQEDKANFILYFVDREKRIPKQNEMVDGFKIGTFWANMKQGKTRYLSILSKNKLLSDDYEKTQKIKDENIGKEKMTTEDKANVLLLFVDREKRVTKINEVVDGFKIGVFWNGIKQGSNRDIYMSILSKKPILSDDYEKTQKIKEERRRNKN